MTEEQIMHWQRRCQELQFELDSANRFLANESLTRRIAELEQENAALKARIAELEANENRQ